MNTLRDSFTARARLGRSLAVLSLAAALPLSLSATLIYYDGFDYTVGEGINGKNGGFGFPGAWSFSNGGDTSANAPFATATVVNGLSFGPLITTGGALRITNRQSTGAHASNVYRPIGDDFASVNSIWSSYLVQVEVAPPVIGTVYDVRFTQGSATGTASLRNGAVQNNATNNPGVAITGPGSVASGALTAGTTYLMIANFSGASNNSFTNAQAWVLTEADFGSFLSAGGDLAALNAHNTFTITHSGAAQSLDSTDFLSLFNFAGNVGTATAIIYDEYRLGTSLADIAPIPEPATYAALLGLISCAVVLYRRRRRG